MEVSSPMLLKRLLPLGRHLERLSLIRCTWDAHDIAGWLSNIGLAGGLGTMKLCDFPYIGNYHLVIFHIANWKIPWKMEVYSWENPLFLWAMASMAMLNNQRVVSDQFHVRPLWYPRIWQLMSAPVLMLLHQPSQAPEARRKGGSRRECPDRRKPLERR